VSWIENTGDGLDGGGSLWTPLYEPPVLFVVSIPLSSPTKQLPDAIGFSPPGWVGLEVCAPSPEVGWVCSDNAGIFDVLTSSVAFGDIDGDGLADLLFAGPTLDGGAGLDVQLTSRPVTQMFFPPPGGQGLSGIQPLQQIAVGDLNRDGFGDLFVFRQDGPWEAWINACGPGASN